METKSKRDRRSTVRAQNSSGLQPKSTAAKSGKNDRSQPKPPAMPLLVAGKEVLGRELTVLREGPNTAVWLPGCVKAFNEPEVLHQIVYKSPLPDTLKNTDDFEPAEWLCLAKHRFVWNENQKWPYHLANPTYSQRFTPQGTSAIGQRVRVWWPFMRKWYTGKVLEYDTSTDHHKVLFTDGDRKTYRIPHEPVVWLDIPQLACDTAIRKMRAEEGDVPVPAANNSNDENKPPESTNCSDGEVNGKERPKSRKDKKEAVATGRKITRAKTLAAATDKSKSTSARGSKGAQAKEVQGSNKAAGIKKAEEPKKAASKKSDNNKKVAEKAPADTQTEAAKPVPKSPQSSRVKSPDSRASALKAKVSSPKTEAAKKTVVKATEPETKAKPSEPQPAEKASSSDPDEDGKEVAVCVKVECCSKDQPCDMLKGAFNNLMRASPAHSRKRNRVQEAVKLAAKPSDDGQPVKASSKLSQVSARPSLKGRPSLGRRDSQLQQSMDSIKGSRVGVWWKADKCFYKGTVITCDVYHRNITVKYDDDIREKSRIDSLQFKWLLPKARSAGATDKLHASFQALGAMNARDPVRLDGRCSNGEVVDVPVKMELREPDKGLHPSRPSLESSTLKCPDTSSLRPAPVSRGQLTATTSGPVSPSHVSNSAFTSATAQLQPFSQAQMMVRHMPSLATLPGLGAAHLLASSSAGQHLASLVPATAGSTTPAGLLPVIQAAAQQASLMGLAPTSQAQPTAQSSASTQAAPRPAALQAAFTPSPAPIVSPAGAASYRRPHQEADSTADVAASPAGAAKAPEGAAVEGWKVSLKFRGNGQVFKGLVLRHNAKTRKCHVLWEDGEDEWLDPNDSDLTWVMDCKKRPGESKKLPSYSAGLPEGMTAPSNEDLIGWRIAVYWPSDGKFYEGTVESCDTELTQHKIQYSDGEERFEELSEEVFKYILPPNVNHPGSHGQSEDSDAEEGAQARRPQKKLKTNHTEDSDDEAGPVRGRSLKNVPSQLNLRLSLGAKDKGIQRMLSGRGSLLLFDREQESPFCSPLSPQGSQAFGLPGQLSLRQDSRNPPACVKNISGLISADGFRVGVKRVRIFLSGADTDAKSPRISKLPKTQAEKKPVSVNNLHQLQPQQFPDFAPVEAIHAMRERIDIATVERLRAMRERIDIATDNIRNSMPLDSASTDLASLPSSLPSMLQHMSSRGQLETGPTLQDQSLPVKSPESNNPAPANPSKEPVPVLEEQTTNPVLTVEGAEDPREPQHPSDIVLTSLDPVVPENLTPPPSPFSGFKEEASAPSGLCPDLVSTLADEFAQENQNSMALPQTPSVNFEAMIRAPSRTGSMGSNHNQSPGRLEPECRPPLDSQKDGPELVRSH